MPFETVDDVKSFFEIDGGPAIRILIEDLKTSEPGRFAKTIAGIFTEASESVAMYGDTNADVADPSFECPKPDLEGVKNEMSIRFLGLLPGEEGYGKQYEIERWAAEGAGTSRVFLKEL